MLQKPKRDQKKRKNEDMFVDVTLFSLRTTSLVSRFKMPISDITVTPQSDFFFYVLRACSFPRARRHVSPHLSKPSECFKVDGWCAAVTAVWNESLQLRCPQQLKANRPWLLQGCSSHNSARERSSCGRGESWPGDVKTLSFLTWLRNEKSHYLDIIPPFCWLAL